VPVDRADRDTRLAGNTLQGSVQPLLGESLAGSGHDRVPVALRVAAQRLGRRLGRGRDVLVTHASRLT
jgi:hypothetical protein